MHILLTLTLAIAVLGLMMIGLGIKILVKKNGEFKRHCSNVDPYTGQRTGCICQQMKPKDGLGNIRPCHNKRKTYAPLEINQEFLDEL